MSKQEEARKKQGYNTDTLNCCGNCANRKFDLKLSRWMQEDNELSIAMGHGERYGDAHLQEKSNRCAIGGFAVKKTAVCNCWKPIATVENTD